MKIDYLLDSLHTKLMRVKKSEHELLETLKTIAREGDPYTATKDWPDPALFANWAIEQAMIAIAKAEQES